MLQEAPVCSVWRGQGAVWTWILPVVLEACGRQSGGRAEEKGIKEREGAPAELRVYTGADLAPEAAEQRAEQIALDVLEHWDTDRVYAPELKTRLTEQMDYVYPFEASGRMKLKFTVSELKKRTALAEEAGQEMYEEPEVLPLIPEFLKEEEVLTGAPRGSAYHKLLELLDFTERYDEENLPGAVAALQREGRLTAEMAECIRTDDILRFLRCESEEG